MKSSALTARAVLALLAWHASATAQTPTPTVIPPTFTFGEARLYPSGFEPVSVTAGRFDNSGGGTSDAFVDLAVVNFSDETVVQFENDGVGRFNRVGTAYSAGEDTFPTWIATLRKNNDAAQEFIYVREPTEIELEAQDFEFFGRADTLRDGPIRAVLPPVTVGEAPSFVRAGVDLNADGSEDAVVVNYFDETLTILLNRAVAGDYVAQSVPSTSSPVAVAFGDVNGDLRPDLVALADAGDLTVHLNLGGTTFANPRFASCGFQNSCPTSVPALQPSALEVADFNQDGKVDVAIADSGGEGVLILRGRGDATFEEPVLYDLGASAERLALGDFNLDGRVDVAVALTELDAIKVLLGLGNGTFSTALPTFTAPSPVSLAAADFNNDGRMDLAVASDTFDAVTVLLNGVSPPAFTPTVTRTRTNSSPPTPTRTPTRTRTITRTPTVTRTPTITATAVGTPSATRSPCPGDCDGDGVLSDTDLLRIVSIINRCGPCGSGGTASGCGAVPGADKQCVAADTDHDGCLTAAELTRSLTATCP